MSVTHDPKVSRMDTASKVLEGRYMLIWEVDARRGCDSASAAEDGVSPLEELLD